MSRLPGAFYDEGVSEPKPSWADDTCGVCPAQSLGPGAFDVVARPGHQMPYRPDLGYRADHRGVPVCVHPYRVGLPAGAYASAGAPMPAETTPVPEPTAEALELPDRLEDLEGWLVAKLRTAEPDQIFGAVARAEREALERFPSREVVTAMRKVLSRELARR
ncbi:hypothetical protein [Actinoplanes sp. NBRC 101535]|uniref:hypothetical protein n=1 Tax=Actinoplanes sp. NBRC 101535 TaxID=3032196 RepID=UPI00249FBC87|nr:hypothetical protein [Actinoplanes sp. NBRC 101535]GLY03781.1 hypothetical protein Acsp01_41600 [Actinoplanes sp. NBRC 101535]